MSNTLEAIQTFLGSNGIGSPGTNLFNMFMPDAPVDSTAIFQTGGVNNPADPTKGFAFQILHRTDDMEAGLNKAIQINSLMGDQWNLSGPLEGRMQSIHHPGPFFRDEAQHIVFSLNYILITTKRQ